MATVSSVGMTTTLHGFRPAPVAEALQGTDSLWERPLAGRVVHNRVRRWRGGAGEGELMLSKVTHCVEGASATAQQDPTDGQL